MAAPILQVRDLRTQFATDGGVVRAVDGINFDLYPGESLGIVGESGSGKSITALSILRLVPEPGRIVSGEIKFRNDDLMKMSDEEIREVRGTPLRSAALLNRCVARAHSTTDAREALVDLGYDVLTTVVPRREVYAQSFGVPIKQAGTDVWRNVAKDLIDRCAPVCSVRS